MSFGREHKGKRVRLVAEVRRMDGKTWPVGTEAVVDGVWRRGFTLSFGGCLIRGVRRRKFEFVT